MNVFSPCHFLSALLHYLHHFDCCMKRGFAGAHKQGSSRDSFWALDVHGVKDRINRRVPGKEERERQKERKILTKQHTQKQHVCAGFPRGPSFFFTPFASRPQIYGDQETQRQHGLGRPASHQRPSLLVRLRGQNDLFSSSFRRWPHFSHPF